MIKDRTFVLMLILLSGSALADNFVGQASLIDGDTLEIHGTRIRLWGVDAPESSQLCRGDDSSQYRCGAEAANDLDAFIARRPSIACRSVSTHMAARLRPVRSAAPILVNGLCATALHWIGPNTRRADMMALSATPNAPAEVSGRAATSSRGSIAPASARAESNPPVRTMQTHIPEQAVMRRIEPTAAKRVKSTSE